MLGSNASVALGALATAQGQRRGANALLALAAIALAVVTWRAVRLDPLPSALPGAPAASGASGAVVASRADEEDAVDIDNDPFRLDRQLPDPPEAEESTVPVADASEPVIVPEMIRLLGTVVLPGARSFVVYQLPSQVPRTLRLGESIGRLTLELVVPGRATFRAGDGTRVELQLPRPGS